MHKHARPGGLCRDSGAGARFGFLDAPSALAWVLGNSNVASAVAGTTRLEHLNANLKASGVLVPNEFTDWIPAGTRAIAPATKSTLFGAGDAAFPDFYDKKVFLFCFCLVSVL